MSGSLSHRFTHGNSGFIMPGTYEHDNVVGGPKREREMIQLAKHQIVAQREAGREIAMSNIAGSQMISDEISRQTLDLTSSLSNMEAGISREISESSNRISTSIEGFGDLLCVEMSEIKWELAQQSKTLENILAVLQQSRNSEAKQLVKQGVRHYVNAEYAAAEERFLKALEFDTTDFQVLYNLGFIELHKNNFNESLKFFEKSLKLPDTLDHNHEALILSTIARLYYVEKNFSKAFDYQKRSRDIDRNINKVSETKDGANNYKMAVYAAHNGDKKSAIEHLKNSILSDKTYFSKSIIDKDLEIIRDEVKSFISSFVVDFKSVVSSNITKAKETIDRLDEDVLKAFKDAKQCTKHYNDIQENQLNFSYLHDIFKFSERFIFALNNSNEYAQSVLRNKQKLLELKSKLEQIENELKIKQKDASSEDINRYWNSIWHSDFNAYIAAVLGFFIVFYFGTFFYGLVGAAVFAGVAAFVNNTYTTLWAEAKEKNEKRISELQSLVLKKTNLTNDLSRSMNKMDKSIYSLREHLNKNHI